MSYISTFFNDLSHLLYPALCPGCGADMHANSGLLCFECVASMPLTGFEQHANNPVEQIFWGRLPLASATAHYYFSQGSALQTLLHQLKYRGKDDTGLQLGKYLGASLRTSSRFSQVDLLIPIPLFKAKEKRRGYNQAAVICEGMAAEMQIPVRKGIVSRKRNTETQTHKSRDERWENIRDRFELNDVNALIGKHVLLVDDVITTGATLESCGAEILKAPGVTLSVAALAYTLL